MTDKPQTTPDIDKYASNEFDKKRLEDAFKTNARSGGTVEINYRDTVIMAPLGDILHNMEKLRNYAPFKRRHVMNSVNKSIRNNFDKMLRHEVDTARAVEIMQDIAIWYSNEILLGKAQLP